MGSAHVATLLEAARLVGSEDAPIELMLDRRPRRAQPVKYEGKVTNLLGPMPLSAVRDQVLSTDVRPGPKRKESCALLPR